MTTGNPEGSSVEAIASRIEESWSALMATMTSYPEVSYTAETDPAGWTALDHMAHVTAWERTWTSFLTARPRHEGLGVTRQEFELGYDEINEILRARTANASYEEVLTDARESHEVFMETLRSVDVSTLDLTDQEGASLESVLNENIITHVDEHRDYIEKMLSS